MTEFKCQLCDKTFETSVCLENHTNKKTPCAFICNLCGLNFLSKQSLDKHKNKKIKCDTITKYQCNKCRKYFTQKHTLIEHTSITCKKYTPIDLLPQSYDKISNEKYSDIEYIIEQEIPTICKVNLIYTYHKHIKLTKDTIQSIIDCPTMDMKVKIAFIKNSEEVAHNNFGEEKIDYIDDNYFRVLLTSYTIEDAYIKLIKDIYLNKDHVENITVSITNINNKFGLVYKNDRWINILKTDLKEKIYERALHLIRENAFKLKKEIEKTQRNQIATFLARKFDDDAHLKDVNEKMLLLFYKSNI
jgi:hypothetical protein